MVPSSDLHTPTLLGEHIDFWRSIASTHVQQWVTQGIKIPFGETIPESFVIKNKNTSPKDATHVDCEIKELLRCGHIKRCATCPYGISPIRCVPKKNGKFRLITDLRHLNNYVSPPSFSNEGIKEVLDIIQPGDHLITIDIKSGFHHVPIDSVDRKYLGFEWKGQYFSWQCLPFGLNCSPFYFSKIIRPVVQYLRLHGIRVVAFVDDFLVMSKPEHATRDKQFVLETLQNLGFTVNFEKSCLQPSCDQDYIGYTLKTDNSDGKVWLHVPTARIRKLRHDIRRTLNKGLVTARALARIAGQCVSMCRVILPGKLLLRNLYRLLKARLSWQDLLQIDTGTSKDLEWWLSALQSWNGKAVVKHSVDMQLTTDASHIGWGAHVNGLKAMGFWNMRMSQEHSNYRELMAVMLAIQSFAEQLQNHSIQLLSDNVTTVAYLNHLGGPSPLLSQLATAIWSECYRLNIQLQAKHLAGCKNQLADQLSRMPTTHEWMLHPAIFNYIDSVFGPHDIDRFASLQTYQVPRYNSYYYDPMTMGVDAFAQTDWHDTNNYVNAPFRLMSKVLDIIEQQQAEATVIAPLWPAQPWYRRLVNLSITTPLKLPINHRTVWSVSNKVEPLHNPRWAIYAWRVSGKPRH